MKCPIHPEAKLAPLGNGKSFCGKCGKAYVDTFDPAPASDTIKHAASAKNYLRFEAMDATVSQARNWLYANLRKGVICPTCDRVAMQRPRAMNEVMVRCMFELVEHAGEDWIHLMELKKRSPLFFALSGGGGDFPFTVHWKLVERNADGQYRITEKGLLFLAGKIRIPAKVFVYYRSNIFFSEETVDVYEAKTVPHCVEGPTGDSDSDA